MRYITTSNPPTDGGFPVDSDLHQMSDDGGPVGPDPARWSDPVWQDRLGEHDLPALGTITIRRTLDPKYTGVRYAVRVERDGGDNDTPSDRELEVMPEVSVLGPRDAAGFSAAVGLRTAVILSRGIEARNQADDTQIEEAVRLGSNRLGRTAGEIIWRCDSHLFN